MSLLEELIHATDRDRNAYAFQNDDALRDALANVAPEIQAHWMAVESENKVSRNCVVCGERMRTESNHAVVLRDKHKDDCPHEALRTLCGKKVNP